MREEAEDPRPIIRIVLPTGARSECADAPRVPHAIEGDPSVGTSWSRGWTKQLASVREPLGNPATRSPISWRSVGPDAALCEVAEFGLDSEDPRGSGKRPLGSRRPAHVRIGGRERLSRGVWELLTRHLSPDLHPASRPHPAKECRRHLVAGRSPVPCGDRVEGVSGDGTGISDRGDDQPTGADREAGDPAWCQCDGESRYPS